MERKLHVQQLESRQLFAADFCVSNPPTPGPELPPAAEGEFVQPDIDGYTPTPADWRSIDEMNFSFDIGSGALPWILPRASIQVGDSLIAVEDNGLRLYGPSADGTGDITQLDYLPVANDDGLSSVRSVKAFGDKLLVVSSRTNLWQTQLDTTVQLLSVGTDHKFHEIDRMQRSSDFQSVTTTDYGFRIDWRVNPNLNGSETEADTSLWKVNQDFVAREEYLVDLIDASADSLPSQPLLRFNNYTTLYSIADGSFATTNDSEDKSKLEVFTPGSEATGGHQVTIPAQVDRLIGMQADGSGYVLTGALTVNGEQGYGTVNVDNDFSVESAHIEASGEQGKVTSELETLRGIFNDGRVPNVTGLRPVVGSYNVRLATQTEQGLVLQSIELPGRNVGMRTALVLDENNAIAFRADVTDILADKTVDLKAVKPEIFAYLLHRDSSGAFQITDTVSLKDFDFRSSSLISADGTITLQNSTHAIILRVADQKINQQSLDIPQNTAVAGFADVVLLTNGNQTKLVSPNAAENATTVIDSLYAALDTNHDGLITPIDALLVINELNSQSRGSSSTAHNLDTNRDGFVTPIDALLIINELNSRSGSGSGEGEMAPPATSDLAVDWSLDLEKLARTS